MKNLFAYDGGLSRRSFLAASAAGLCALSLSPLDALSADAGSWGKILVLYYSRSGNTRAVAEEIHTKVGGDIFQLKTARPYPESYDDVVEIAKKEKTSNARPAYAEPVPDLNSFNTVFIGYPCWWGTMPMVFFTLLGKYPLAGKTIVPFTTHGGSGFGDSLRDLKRLCPKAKILQGLEVRGTAAHSSEDRVSSWLKKLGFVL